MALTPHNKHKIYLAATLEYELGADDYEEIYSDHYKVKREMNPMRKLICRYMIEMKST